MSTDVEIAERIAEELMNAEPGWARAHAAKRPQGNTAKLLRLVTDALATARASHPAPVEVRGVVTVIPGDFTVTGAALVCVRFEEQGAWFPAFSGAHVGQRVTVTVTPEE